MSHINAARKELVSRINRVQGQLDAIKEAVQKDDQECGAILQQAAACRGAINSLVAEIIEGEIKGHILSSQAKANSSEARAADDLVEVLRRYLK